MFYDDGRPYSSPPINKKTFDKLVKRVRALEDIMLEEQQLRKKYPGLQELYTQYQVMLALVKENKNV